MSDTRQANKEKRERDRDRKRQTYTRQTGRYEKREREVVHLWPMNHSLVVVGLQVHVAANDVKAMLE